ncbi:VanZ family protein [Nemorincola caseinilytica]
MKRIFTTDSPYTRQARFMAIAWTLLIFIGCLMPAHEIPRVDVPLADKWTHFLMFGIFSFLWLCARPAYTFRSLLILLLITVFLGCLIEYLQGMLTFLGRSMEIMDAVADAIGGLLGIVMFRLGAYFARV